MRSAYWVAARWLAARVKESLGATATKSLQAPDEGRVSSQIVMFEIKEFHFLICKPFPMVPARSKTGRASEWAN